ncbi:MAG: flagellar biosynthesis protein FliQ [Halieaceae bacterium]
MDADTILQIGRESLYLTVMLAAPLLLSALAVGLLIGVFQAATQIQEQTLSFIPKLIALVFALVLGGPWMVNSWVFFCRHLFEQIPTLIG